ncbi:hypothetical protein, conserved [Babesia ovata]|uniref:Uncharacterized protein n=1 Tax=Babesia ovata TaxID=189622 RepID=A0A2H6KDJ0_9APIC|nr:uncharacterized protein BOVATA_025120 [Babesia ovata]GBE61019.1 hypothetical protein, conserved [Babesia ovata]
MAYTSLTDVPRNLKEGIDWLIALKGADAEKNLKAMGSAVYDLLADKPVGFTEVPALENVKRISKEFLEKPELKNQRSAKKLLKRYRAPMVKNLERFARYAGFNLESDYKNIIETRGVKPEDVVEDLFVAVYGCEKFLEKIKCPDKYESSYSSEATWESSCAQDPEACAAVLVGIAPMLYIGIRSLQDASRTAIWKGPSENAKKRLVDVLKAVGYEEPQRCAGLSGSDVLKALEAIDLHVLITIYEFAGFWAFY